MEPSIDGRLIRGFPGDSRRRWGPLARGLLLGSILTWGGGLFAQETATVMGRVLDDETQAPLMGAFVTLLDRDGVRRGGVLTDQTGRFVLRASAPGEFRLRTERIGVESLFTGFFRVTPGQVVVRDLLTRPAAVALQGVEVTGESRCDLRGAEGSATVQLWEEARKALEVAEWVDAAGYIYDTRSFERVLAPDGRRVLEETTRAGVQMGRTAFRSLEAHLLLSRGFIQEEGGEMLYYAPDAAVLLSDEFLATHCFRAVRESGVLGLAFEPAPERRMSDIRGTLWFGAQGVLDRLEFHYTALPPEVRGSPLLGGEIHFYRLQEGAWIVREWRIRMPRLVRVLSRTGETLRMELDGIHEVGGEVRSARRAQRVEAVFDARRGAVRGTVTEEPDGSPLPGAEVYLSGTGYAAVAAGDGSFLLENVRPGLYDLVLDHPVLDALGEPPVTLPVDVLADSVAVANLEIPARSGVLLERCRGMESLELSEPDFRADGDPALLGGVVLDADGRPVAGWPVRVRWTRFSLDANPLIIEDWRGTVVFTDENGGWAVCGLPADVGIVVEPSREAMERRRAAAGEGRWYPPERVGLVGPGDGVWMELRLPR